VFTDAAYQWGSPWNRSIVITHTSVMVLCCSSADQTGSGRRSFQQYVVQRWSVPFGIPAPVLLNTP
jgi:hypothetical protein